MADKGWDKAYHHWLDATFWNNEEPYDERSAYLDLILRANYKDKVFRPKRSSETITVHKGEIFTSVGNLGKRWKWSENKVRRYLKMMENCNFLRATAYTSGTLVTLINTDKTEDERRACEGAYGRTDGRTGERTNGRTGGRRLKKDKEREDRQESKEIKPSGFVWGDLE